ncbi:hypothetical protein [Sphingomonas faeni]|uniref:hypothetical protein n=1 Tax=Sphingomonas faeni TaxID=185950 RepID=UPI0011B27425|nr:hypothetical protein [Sphingomonas faeni]
MDVSVGSANEWDRLIAEGDLDRKIGFIVSDESAGDFCVSLFNLLDEEGAFSKAREDFAYYRNQPFRTVRLDDLIKALCDARDRLVRL